LVKLESNQGLQDTDKGRLYLRYQTGPGATQFWAFIAPSPALCLSLRARRAMLGILRASAPLAGPKLRGRNRALESSRGPLAPDVGT